MEKDYHISIFLDTRRVLKTGKYPVKVRVFTPVPRIQKLYKTKFAYTKEEFKSIWETTKPLNKNKAKRRELQELLNNAEDVANSLNTFTIPAFEKKLSAKSGRNGNVFSYYKETIQSLESVGKIGTADNYRYSQNSLKNYLTHKTGSEAKYLYFKEITPEFLSQYEYYMLHDANCSLTTVGFYLRPLRALFNKAIGDKAIHPDIYPFRKNLYQIPAPQKVKKALTKAELKTLLTAKPKTEEQHKARNYWFFLYNAAGINVKDMALLKYANLQENRVVYIREKTKQTSKANLKPVVFYLNDYTYWFLDTYANKKEGDETFIFPILTEGLSEEEQYRRIKNFTKFINQNLKKLAKANGITDKISTYWGRHTFATASVQSGVSLEQISQALNHKDMTTTLRYFAGFEDETMQKIADNLMDFI